MSYTWTNGEVITAEKLNQTGGSPWIIEMTFVPDGYNTHCESTAKWDDVVAAVTSGTTVMVKLPNTEESIGYGVYGTVFMILGYAPAYEEGASDDLLISSSYYSGTAGSFGYLYKNDEGYMCGYVYVD